MLKRVIYRYVGGNGRRAHLRNGQFITKDMFDSLPATETIRQEIKVADPNEVRYVTHQL